MVHFSHTSEEVEAWLSVMAKALGLDPEKANDFSSTEPGGSLKVFPDDPEADRETRQALRAARRAWEALCEEYRRPK